MVNEHVYFHVLNMFSCYLKTRKNDLGNYHSRVTICAKGFLDSNNIRVMMSTSVEKGANAVEKKGVLYGKASCQYCVSRLDPVIKRIK